MVWYGMVLVLLVYVVPPKLFVHSRATTHPTNKLTTHHSPHTKPQPNSEFKASSQQTHSILIFEQANSSKTPHFYTSLIRIYSFFFCFFFISFSCFFSAMDCWSPSLTVDEEFEKLVIRMNPPRYFIYCGFYFSKFFVYEYLGWGWGGFSFMGFF